MIKFINYIKENNLGKYYCNKTFKDITTLKMGGKINLLFYPNSVENFVDFYRFYLNNKKYNLIIIGNGSNILASSNDYQGIVISFKQIIYKYSIIKNIVFVNSGVMIMDLINYLKKYNLGGIEKLSYIPATIGGMVKMNAGAYKQNISDKLLYVKCIDNNGNIHIYKKEDLKFEYRKCYIDDIILECVFELDYIDSKIINEIMNKIKNNRITKQPINEYNAGSTFKNFNDIQAWKLIDKCGFRGYCINDVGVSNKHCNFLINKNNGKSEDMIKLINMIMYKIKQEFNYDLECEWILINF